MSVAETDFSSLSAFPSDWGFFSFVGGVAAAGNSSLYTVPSGFALFDYTSTPPTTEEGFLAVPPTLADEGQDGSVEVVFRSPLQFADSSQDELAVLIAVGFRSTEDFTAWIGAAVKAHWDGLTWDIPFEFYKAEPSGAGLTLSDQVTPFESNLPLDIWQAVNSVKVEVQGDDLTYSFNGVISGTLVGAASGFSGAKPVVFVQVYSEITGVRTNYAAVQFVRVELFEFFAPKRDRQPALRVQNIKPLPDSSYSIDLPVKDMIEGGVLKQLDGGTYETTQDVHVYIDSREDQLGDTREYLFTRGTRFTAISQGAHSQMRSVIVDLNVFRARGVPT